MKFYLTCKQGKKVLWERHLSELSFSIPQRTMSFTNGKIFDGDSEPITIEMSASIKNKADLRYIIVPDYEMPVVSFEKIKKKRRKK